MSQRIGIRREDKNSWEARVPLTPPQVKQLGEEHNVQVVIQPSTLRIFSDKEYKKAGATVQEDLSECPLILGVKEMPRSFFEPEKSYLFFSHVIKGQPYNMPMLRTLLERRCQLLDYEKITDEVGRRLIFFGRHAGLAGMLDTLWTLGQRLQAEGWQTPLATLQQAVHYTGLQEGKEAVRAAGEAIARDGLSPKLAPLVVGITGYGNVSQGAQEILDLLPTHTITPEVLLTLSQKETSPHQIYKVVFREEDMVEPVEEGKPFVLQDYFERPAGYRSRFARFLPHLDVLVNAIYWSEDYPRLVTRQLMRELHQAGPLRLQVIGDLSCDIEGSVEITLRSTTVGEPVFVYDVAQNTTREGFYHPGAGPTVMAIDNLPCELPADASTHFGEQLLPFVPDLAAANYRLPFDQCTLPPPLRRATIVYHGDLTPHYQYLKEFLQV